MRPTITVVGLGPAGADSLSGSARRYLAGADAAYLRTSHHPAAAEFGDVASFDHHYAEAATFDEVYERIVADLVTTAQVLSTDGKSVVYAVPGSPFVAERTVELLRADRRVALRVVPAMSFLDLAWSRLGVDPLSQSVRLVDGTRFSEQAAGERGPLLVAQCWSTEILSQIKLAIEDLERGDEPMATVLHHLGLPDEVVATVPWHELDRAVVPDHLTTVWVPHIPVAVASELVALDELVRRLRAECPWDREQTHASLTRHLLEEAYEVIDAIDALTQVEADAGAASAGSSAGVGSSVGGLPEEAAAVAHLEEELGDLLFQVYFHSRLAAEEGRFTLADVAKHVHDKLVSRHPHVFGDVVAHDAGAVLRNWEELKMAEKGRTSVTDGIPTALPALALSAKLQGKATAVPSMPIVAFGDERAEALSRLAALPTPGSSARAATPDAGTGAGELLWAVADLVRRIGVDPEDALRSAALRFRDRVRHAERAESAEGAR